MTTQPAGVTLTQYVKAVSTDAAFVTACETEAETIVAEHIGVASVPAEVRRRAVLEVAADLFYRRKSQNGITVFGGGDVDLTPLRIARDPLHAARELLRPYLGGPFA